MRIASLSGRILLDSIFLGSGRVKCLSKLLGAVGAVLLLFALPPSSLVSAGQERRGPEVYLGFLGDGGTGGKDQKRVARRLEIAREAGRLDDVFLLGDNIYNNGEAKFIGKKYLNVYRKLLDEGVVFHAALGNHDVTRCDLRDLDPLPANGEAYVGCDVDQQLDPTNRFGYRDGERYYDVLIEGGKPAAEVDEPPLAEVFVLDTNTLASSQSFLETGDDRRQLEWLDKELGQSRATWKIVTMHHPIHSPSSAGWFSGHSREVELGDQLEPIFTRHGVDVVFAGHNHFYARVVPQKGIRYFVSGGGGKGMYRYEPQEGYVVPDPERGKFHHFIHVRVSRESIEYCVVDADGAFRDGGRFRKNDALDRPFDDGRCPY